MYRAHCYPTYTTLRIAMQSACRRTGTNRLSLFTPSTHSTRPFSVTSRRRNRKILDSDSSSLDAFRNSAPPRLPKEEQELFEALQKQSTGAFSTPRNPPRINQSPDASHADVAQAESTISERTDKISPLESSTATELKKVIEARGKGEELHPNVRRGAPPEFEGDVNPKTGEVGGPKNEPLRWGASGEWAYNGRTTDF